MAVAVAASLGAALLYAIASVLQHRAAVGVAVEHSMRLGLLARLIAKPWWLAGIAADTLAFGLQFLALGNGPLVVVQPLLVSGLLFALPMGAWISGKRIRASELWAGSMVVAGLACLLLLGNPGFGHGHLTPARWVALTVAVLLPTGALILAASRSSYRPALLAAAAGIIYGYTAALATVAAHALGHGIGHALATWQLWALIPGGLLGMVICQSAFQAGPLKASLPTLTAVDPVVSVAIGVLAFHEHVDRAALNLIGAAIGLVLMVAGVLVLGRSPLVALEEEPEPVSASASVTVDGAHPA